MINPHLVAFDIHFLENNQRSFNANDPQILTSFTGTVITLMTFIAGALAVIYLIYSGILYITAAGNPDAAKKGQQGIINGIIGIIVITLAYFLVTAVATAVSGASPS